MNALVVYDSQFGNTERIAQTIGTILEARTLNVVDASASDLNGIDLLVVGSPTQGGRPTAAIQAFLQELPVDALKGVRVAAFDTRIDASKHGPFLRILTKVIGYAGGRIDSSLSAHGGMTLAQVQGFIVDGREGPLANGEEERAATWATVLITAGAGRPAA